MAKIDDYFRMMADLGASDLHLVSGQRPVQRINGDLERVTTHGMLDHEGLKQLL